MSLSLSTQQYLDSLLGKALANSRDRELSFYQFGRVLEQLGNPQSGRKALHIAGTKGKGSVAYYSDAILRAHGVTTLRFTSPHLESIEERITLSGNPITSIDLSDCLLRVRAAAQSLSITPHWFQALNAAAWLAAHDAEVQVDVLEVGLGGRLDATNLCPSTISVITSIGWDHSEILGDTLEAIAAEKGGILKSQVPVLLGLNANEPGFKVLTEIASSVSSPLLEATWRITERFSAPSFNRERGLSAKALLQHKTQSFKLELPGGAPQMNNAVLALSASEHILESLGMTLDPHRSLKALAHSPLPGRWQWIAGRPATLLDGSHTPESIAALADGLRSVPLQTKVALIGLTRDRNPARVFAPLLPGVQAVYCAPLPSERGFPPEELAARVAPLTSHPVMGASTLHEALQRAQKQAGKEGLVVGCGSFTMIAPLIRLLQS